MATSVRISSLDNIPIIRGVDFLPVVQSGSTAALTTYKAPVDMLVGYFAVSGSVWSASFASASISSSHAILSDSASYLYSTFVYKATVSASVTSSFSFNAVTSSWSAINLSSSHAIRSDSSSFLSPGIYLFTASYALNAGTASLAVTSSLSLVSNNLLFPNTSTASYAISASHANNSDRAISASFASSATNAVSASFIPASQTFIRAFGTILMNQANLPSTLRISSASYNIQSVVDGGAGGTVIDGTSWWSPLGTHTLHVNLPGRAIYVTFTNPMPTVYYTVINTYNGYEPYGYEGVQTYITPIGQTLNGYTMSWSGGDGSNTEGKFICNFVVYHP